MARVSDNPDTRLIEICQRMLAIHHAQAALAERDPDAPDCGPNHERYEALWAEYAALEASLTTAAAPITPEGIQALAELAMTFAVRTFEGDLGRPEHFADWLRLFALSSAAGEPEPIPRPRC